MQEKSIILTPNKRLAQYWQNHYPALSALPHKPDGTNIEILPLTTWLINCWQACSDPHTLLSPLQEKILWQKIITENLGKNFNHLASLAIDYHQLINGWQLKNTHGANDAGDDIAIFQSLYTQFTEYCKYKKLVTVSELPTLIIPYLATYRFATIIWVGFDEYNPQLQALIAAIDGTGCNISHLDPNNQQAASCKRLSFGRLKQELTTSALWAKHIINTQAASTIGIVIPNLVELRPQIAQIFAEIIGKSSAFNISAGAPLTTLPVIKWALELLALAFPLELKTIKHLVLSPYIRGAKQESSQRILLNLHLQQLDQPQVTLNNIKQIAEQHNKPPSLLLETLSKWQELMLTIQHKKLSHAEWGSTFMQILQTLGWPGEHGLTATEEAAIAQFTQALQALPAADLISDSSAYHSALQILQEALAPLTIQPEPVATAPINIMGILEAAGINFDYLWVMGLDADHWPTASKPNPFIPIALQRKLFLPHSSPAREFYFCDTLIKRYKRSAQEIIFSYVNQKEDYHLAPSPLIADILETPLDSLNLTPAISLAETIYHSQKLEILTNDCAPPLTAQENLQASSRLLELQSLCPFRAFAEFRLKAKELKQPSLGISKTTRGILIHSALEQFWQQIKSQQQLCALSASELHQAIQKSIEKSLTKLPLSPPIYLLEKQRLTSLLTAWLALEKERLPFKVIATEKTIAIKLATIPINLRVDRIDQLSDGKILLLDYKTSKNLPSVFDWFGLRPKNLQLLLYSVAVDAVEGLALVQINAEVTKFKVISLKELASSFRMLHPTTLLPQELTWQDLIKYWRDILTKLATEFASGVATVAPLSPQVCKQCSLDAICRIN